MPPQHPWVGFRRYGTAERNSHRAGTPGPRGRFQSSRITETDSPTRLLDLTHQQFYNLVDQDVRNRLDEAVAQKLRDPAVVERWFLVLIQMKKNVESQLASARADWQTLLFTILAEIEDAETDQEAEGKRVEQFQKHSKYSEQRAKKLRFRSAVEDSLAEARYLRNQQVEQRASTQLAFMTVRVHELGTAIQEHRSNCQSPDGNTRDIDKQLWSVIGMAD